MICKNTKPRTLKPKSVYVMMCLEGRSSGRSVDRVEGRGGLIWRCSTSVRKP